jgi:hypothetical protein
MSLRMAGWLLLLLLMAEIPAAAYVDPGTGTLLWQLLIGALVGCSFYVRRLFTWFKKK